MGRITHQSAKGKGRRLQQWVAAKISDITGYRWGSSGEDHPIESRPMGQSGTDIRMESQVLKLFPYSIECKAQESWNIAGFIEQAQTNVLPDTNWLLICKKNRKEPVAVFSYGHCTTLLGKFEIDMIAFKYCSDRWSFDNWIADAEKEGNWLIQFARKSHSEWYCMMDANAFFNLFPKPKLKRTR